MKNDAKAMTPELFAKPDDDNNSWMHRPAWPQADVAGALWSEMCQSDASKTALAAQILNSVDQELWNALKEEDIDGTEAVTGFTEFVLTRLLLPQMSVAGLLDDAKRADIAEKFLQAEEDEDIKKVGSWVNECCLCVCILQFATQGARMLL